MEDITKRRLCRHRIWTRSRSYRRFRLQGLGKSGSSSNRWNYRTAMADGTFGLLKMSDGDTCLPIAMLMAATLVLWTDTLNSIGGKRRKRNGLTRIESCLGQTARI